jgi:hypothetical protein
LRVRIAVDGSVIRADTRRAPVERRFGLSSSAAAQWLAYASAQWHSSDPQALAALVRHCWPWTAGANGAGFDIDEEAHEQAYEWNAVYFSAMVSVALTMGDQGVQETLIAPLGELADERFFDAAAVALHELDRQWLGDGRVADATALAIRAALAKRMLATAAWERLASGPSTGAEIHLSGAISAMFCAEYEMGRGPRCYLLPPGADRAYLLLPTLESIAVQAAGSTFVALAFMALIEVRPEPAHLAVVARVMTSWWQVRGADSEFWNDYGIGRRIMDWIAKGVVGATNPPLDSVDLTAVVDILVRCGTPLARALEERIAARRGAI